MRQWKKGWLIGIGGIVLLAGVWAAYRTSAKPVDTCCQKMAAGNGATPSADMSGALPPGHPDIRGVLPPGHPDIGSVTKRLTPSDPQSARGKCPYLAEHPEAKAASEPARSKT